MSIDTERMANIYSRNTVYLEYIGADGETYTAPTHVWTHSMSLSLLSFLLLSLSLYFIILRSSQNFKKIRERILENGSIVSEETIEDLEWHGPYFAAFCLQYTLMEYQHEERAIVRKIIWILGMKLVQLEAVMLAINGSTDNLAACRTAVSSSILVATNLWYIRHLLKRPYASHRPSKKIGDPMNDAEILTTSAVSVAAAILR